MPDPGAVERCAAVKIEWRRMDVLAGGSYGIPGQSRAYSSDLWSAFDQLRARVAELESLLGNVVLNCHGADMLTRDQAVWKLQVIGVLAARRAEAKDA